MKKILAIVLLITSSCVMATDTEEEKTFEEEVFEYVDSLPFLYPDIVKAQIILETGNFSSRVFKENNNLFGMRMPASRLTTATGSKNKYAEYNTWQESIIDRLIYESKYLYKYKNKGEYFAFLDRIYAEGEYYSKTLKTIIRKNLQ